MDPTIPCRLCGAESRLRFEGRVLGRHTAGYYRCGDCGLTQTQEPAWLEEAYAEPISAADTGLLARNLRLRAVVATFLALAGAGDRPGLDWAGGHGVFTRLMRDSGFDFHWQDPYAQNLFARGFEWREELGPPAVVTAFEVLEHLVWPAREFAGAAGRGADFIITSTELPPRGEPAPGWAYLLPATGQHVAFWTAGALARLGRELGYPHVIAGPFRQIFARHPFPAWRWHLANRLGHVLHPLLARGRRSFTVPDSERLLRGREAR